MGVATDRCALPELFPVGTTGLLFSYKESGMSQPIKSKRLRAYNSQHGKCYYCGIRMWLDDPHEVRQNRRVPLRALSQMRCTAEHLHARSDGGSDKRSNIVAACLFCNRNRHRMKRPMDAAKYREFVKKRIRKKRWYMPQIRKLFQESAGVA